MSESILDSTKKVLGLDSSYTAFDQDVILFINGTFSTLNQLGIGPEGGYSIASSTETWDAFIGTNKKLNSVKTYVYLCVRMQFDPPQTGYLMEALQKQKLELEWRLNVTREMTDWTDPTPEPITDNILDGGTP